MQNQIFMSSPANHGKTAADQAKSAKQWSNLRNVLIYNGKDVIVLPKSELLRSVYTIDAGCLIDNTLIESRLKDIQYSNIFSEWFKQHEYTIKTPHTIFEGRDLVPDKAKNILWFGFGPRSSLNYKGTLDVMLENTNYIVRGLELVKPEFANLNTCFCPLETGDLIWYPDAFSEYSQSIIELWYAGNNFKISREDAAKLVCNAISIHQTIILPINLSTSLKDTFFCNGYTVITLDTCMFGNSISDLILRPLI